MKKLLSIVALLAIALFLVLYQPQNIAAQSGTPVPVIENAETAFSELNNFTTSIISTSCKENCGDPASLEGIDDVAEKIKVTFPDAEGDLRVCLRADLCMNDAYEAVKLLNLTPDGFEKITAAGIPVDSITEGFFSKTGLDGEDSIIVCGAGEANLKTDCGDEKKNYFHAGHTYFITVYEKGDNWIIRRRAGIYINHHLPIVEVLPLNNNAPEKFKITLKQDALSKDGKESNNNFQIVAQGAGGYKQERCIPRDAGGKLHEANAAPYELEFPFAENGKLASLVAGKYTIKINEQVDESKKIFGVGTSNNCGGGYTYLRFECSVFNDKPTTCKKIEDPNGSDSKHLRELLDVLGKEKSSIIPCKEGQPNPGLLNCDALDTAIGPIPLNPVGFITKLFQLVLAVAGLGATILIIYAGYRLLLSRGDKEVIQAQRDRITSAIVGLLFIIFSLVLLSVIAGDVLKIPGFDNNPLPQLINTQ